MLRLRPALLSPLLAVVAVLVLIGARTGVPRARVVARGGGCGPAQAHTVLQDAQARVYSSASSAPRGRDASQSLAACLRGHAGSVVLGPGTGRQRIGPLALTGHVLAYGATMVGIDTGAAELVVFDLARARTVHRQAAATAPIHPESFSRITDLVVSAAGASAWIAQKSAIAQRPVWEVHRVDVRGSTLLDAGPSVVPGSLRRVAGNVTWREGGRQRSASLR